MPSHFKHSSWIQKTGIYLSDDHIFFDDMFLLSLVLDQAVPQQEVDESTNANLPAPIAHDTDDVAQWFLNFFERDPNLSFMIISRPKP